MSCRRPRLAATSPRPFPHLSARPCFTTSCCCCASAACGSDDISATAPGTPSAPAHPHPRRPSHPRRQPPRPRRPRRPSRQSPRPRRPSRQSPRPRHRPRRSRTSGCRAWRSASAPSRTPARHGSSAGSRSGWLPASRTTSRPSRTSRSPGGAPPPPPPPPDGAPAAMLPGLRMFVYSENYRRLAENSRRQVSRILSMAVAISASVRVRSGARKDRENATLFLPRPSCRPR